MRALRTRTLSVSIDLSRKPGGSLQEQTRTVALGIPGFVVLGPRVIPLDGAFWDWQDHSKNVISYLFP